MLNKSSDVRGARRHSRSGSVYALGADRTGAGGCGGQAPNALCGAAVRRVVAEVHPAAGTWQCEQSRNVKGALGVWRLTEEHRAELLQL